MIKNQSFRNDKEALDCNFAHIIPLLIKLFLQPLLVLSETFLLVLLYISLVLPLAGELIPGGFDAATFPTACNIECIGSASFVPTDSISFALVLNESTTLFSLLTIL